MSSVVPLRECLPLSAREKQLADEHPDSCAQEIVPGLFLGPFTCLRDQETIQRCRLEYVVNLSARCSCIAKQLGVAHIMDVMIEDEVNANIMVHLPAIYAFIDAALDSGVNVLVNCAMGISRSGTAVVGYLMHKHNWSVDESLLYVKQRRACVAPNPGFLIQLTHQRLPTLDEIENME